MSEVKRFSVGVDGVDPNENLVRYVDYAALQQKLDAANAEREKLAVQCAAAKIAVQAAQAAGFECTLNTPAVDAYMNAVRAEGVDMAANFLIKADTVGSTGAMGHALHSLSLELRAETDTTPSQYESLAGGK